MRYSQSYTRDAYRNKIFRQSWQPDVSARAVILLAHGLSEHSSRYQGFVDRFVPQGFAIYSWDHPGHGRSGGDRKYVNHFSDFTNVLTDYLDVIKQQHPDLPIYAFGHSMGGLITTHYLLEHQQAFRGAILSAPALKVFGGVSTLTLLGGRLLSKICPKFRIKSIDGDYISRDPKVVEDANSDPLNEKGSTSIRLLAELVGAMQRVERDAHRITLPILILQGTGDRIIDPAGAELLYQKVSSKDKTLKHYPGLYHELLNEPEKDDVLNDIEAWLQERSGK